MGKILFLLVTLFLIFSSCIKNKKTEKSLTKKDLEYINSIIPLEKEEGIELFDTNAGFSGIKTAGNFITNKRLAHYWIDGKNDKICSIKYSDIDSLKTVNKTNAATYASYIQVYSSTQKNFKVYIDADNTRTKNFFKKAKENWKKINKRG